MTQLTCCSSKGRSRIRIPLQIDTLIDTNPDRRGNARWMHDIESVAVRGSLNKSSHPRIRRHRLLSQEDIASHTSTVTVSLRASFVERRVCIKTTQRTHHPHLPCLGLSYYFHIKQPRPDTIFTSASHGFFQLSILVYLLVRLIP